MNDTKHILQSKTFWINLIALLTMIIGAWSSLIPTSWQPYLGAILATGNIIVRFYTTQAVTLSTKDGNS